MFILLRRIERWLHQHIFKVGWLLTQNYQTTTILYYTIFLPGVVLHELVFWLSAGMLNVRANRSIKWPAAQEVGELKLNFVQINPKASTLRKAIIAIAPLLFGLVSIWYIAHNIFDITAVFRQMSSGNLRDVVTAFNMLLDAPLFWMWVYIIFTIANTMYPSVPKDLQGWRSVLLGLGTVALALLLLGLGGEIFEALQTPLSELIFVLQATFVLMIAVDVVMVLILGLIEYTIERVTGNSATFRGGKMITVTREEALEEQRKQRELELKEQAKKRNPAADSGPKSIYALAFSIPGIPPQEPVTLLKEHSQASIEMPAVVVEEEEKKPATVPLFGGIAAATPEETKPISQEQKQQREAIAAKINLPERLTPPKETPKPEEKAPAASKELPAKEEDKRQSSLFDKAGTSETEKSEEEKPVASRFGAFSKPAITAPKDDEDETELEETETEEKPVASRFGGFTKPAIPAPKVEGDEDAEQESEEKPVASRFGGFNKPAISSPKVDDEDVEEEPAASRFSGFTKPAITSPKDASSIGTPSMVSDDSEEAEKPVASRFGDFTKPAITASKDEDEEEPKEKPSIPTTSRFAGFTKPSSEENKAPSTSRFGASPFKPVGESDKEEKSATTGRFASTEFKRLEEDGDEEEKPTTGSRFGTSPFGGSSRLGATRPAPKPLAEDEDESDEDEESPRTSSPLLGKPSSPFGSPRPAPKSFGKVGDDDEVEEEDETPRSRVSGFGLLGKRPKDDEIVYEDDDDDFRNFDDDDDYVDSDDED